MTPDTLLMFSGGLDSTGAFWQLIKENKNIHVHHMHLKNIEKRCDAESAAVYKICEYIKNIYNFKYTESTHEYPVHGRGFIWDADIASFIAGTICLTSPNIKYVALGRTASDGNVHETTRIKRAHDIFNSFGTKAIKIYPVEKLTKEEIHNMLPEDLRNLTWSCRRPTYKDGIPIKCGKCKTCHDISKYNK